MSSYFLIYTYSKLNNHTTNNPPSRWCTDPLAPVSRARTSIVGTCWYPGPRTTTRVYRPSIPLCCHGAHPPVPSPFATPSCTLRTTVCYLELF